MDMDLIDIDINHNDLLDTIKLKVGETKNSLLALQRNYLRSIESIKLGANNLMDSVKAFEDLINGKLNLITDKVFVKQIKKRISEEFAISNRNITYEEANNAYEKFSSDINDIINSSVPVWVSSVIYTFNQNWRKAVYTTIMENYLILYTYVCEQKFIASNIDQKIQELNEKFYLEANARVGDLLSFIQHEVNNNL